MRSVGNCYGVSITYFLPAGACAVLLIRRVGPRVLFSLKPA